MLRKTKKSFKEITTPRERKFWRAGMHSISILFLGMVFPVLSMLEFLVVINVIHWLVGLGYLQEPSGNIIMFIYLFLNVMTGTVFLWMYFKKKSFQRVLLKMLFWFSPLNDLID